ncbi:hypothetical protein [Actinoplanes sp. N902-109]|uniref:hypothetical protein n=1 Tax=Actinoplanes sp. (strain N902-109) TaxID=649831 RepID=UPI000329509C|nr:hypothetical protein [Actinoplanes sp. N902-109]AGL16006.1 hypothetical protein L083_2496 [Actinoplanes sp. N902-109]
MSNASSWSVLAAGQSNRIILAVDFPAAGRKEAGFTDLAAKMASAWTGYELRQTVLPGVRLTERPPGEYYTEHWINGTDWADYEVVAVIGYCAGSIYAAEVAQRLTRWQTAEPQVVLFDPQLIDTRVLALEMRKMIGLAGPIFTPDEAQQARERADQIAQQHAGAMYDAAIAILGLYREMATTAFARIGLDNSRLDEVTRLFESYMTYLSAASQVDPIEVWKRSIAITSTDYARMENQGETVVLEAAKVVGNRFSLGVDHADLMRSDSAVQILFEQTDF